MESLDLQILNTGLTMTTSSKRKNVRVGDPQLVNVSAGMGSVIANMKRS